MTLDVSRIGPEAADILLAVVQEAFCARPTLDPPADALTDNHDTMRAALAAGGGLVATLDDRVVGGLVFDPQDGVMFLRRVGVLPEVQRHGVAHALVAVAVAEAAAQQRPEVAVVARSELPRTISFWEAAGFERAELRPPYVELRRPSRLSIDELLGEHLVPDAVGMRALGERLGRVLKAGDLVLLTGELGAGKTTLTQGIGAGLGVRGDVTSPTFVIARVHPSLGAGPDLVHADAYRLGGAAELDDLDLDTALDAAVTVVEWGEGIAEGLAEEWFDVRIERALGSAYSSGAAAEQNDPRRVTISRGNSDSSAS